MSEFSGSVLGECDNLCVTASQGRNFVPTNREFLSDRLRNLSMAIDFASVMAFVAFVLVMSI